MSLRETYKYIFGTTLPLERLYIEFSDLIFNKSSSQCECAGISLSRLAMVALAACGWRQTQLDGKQPFTVASRESRLPTMQAYGSNSMEELTLW